MNPGNLLLDTKGIANTFEITDSTNVPFIVTNYGTAINSDAKISNYRLV